MESQRVGVFSGFVLASSSPRRCQLLEQAGYRFDIIAPPILEIPRNCLTIREQAVNNAVRKAVSVAHTFSDALVLGADTIVGIDDQPLWKPINVWKAKQTLRRLSGRWHEVWTAVCVCHLGAGRLHAFGCLSRVEFRVLTESVIENYLARVNPLDKAGAYAVQCHGTEIIKRIEGSYSNIIGLPMEATTHALRAFGVTASK